MSLRNEGYVESVGENGECRNHVIAAQALMQPINGQSTEELFDKDQTGSDAAVEMACYSLCRDGNRLVIEDLESDSGAVTWMESNGIGHPPLDVREAWPDKTVSVSTDRDPGDVTAQKQLLV